MKHSLRAWGLGLLVLTMLGACNALPEDDAGEQPAADQELAAKKCGGGKSLCGGKCVNLATDENNCGVCGSACASDATCDRGRCSGGACPVGLTACAGTCVDLNNSSSNCGGCGKVCPTNTTCRSGVCQSPCAPGTVLCGNSCCPAP